MDKKFLLKTINDVFSVGSPSGYFVKINEVIARIFDELGISYTVNKKGNIKGFIKGKSSKITRCLSAHCDTLGLMVRSINSDGTLNVTRVGGPSISSLDSEYCTIVTKDNKEYTGTILYKHSSVHVYSDSDGQRKLDNMIVRIDEVVKTKEDVLKLGINNGDYIIYDPKTVVTSSGFLKSRFIDDKGSVCAILTLLKKLKDEKIEILYDTYICFTNLEEIGHGGSSIENNIDEMVAVDMGCIGLDLAGDEYSVSICALDSSGPYDYELTSRLINQAKSNNVKHVVDIFPYYSSDVSAFYKAGGDFKGALIGPGVSASHAMERTHLDAIYNTIKLLEIYLTN